MQSVCGVDVLILEQERLHLRIMTKHTRRKLSVYIEEEAVIAESFLVIRRYALRGSLVVDYVYIEDSSCYLISYG